MVSTMASAYEGLSEEERQRVFLLAVGKDKYQSNDQKFCQGFAACADSSWWTDWDAAQRDVFFYMKTNPEDDKSWEYYCRYSMDDGRDEFDDTIRAMLDVTASSSKDIDGFGVTGNATSIGPEKLFSNHVQVASLSQASSSSNFVLFFITAAVLGRLII